MKQIISITGNSCIGKSTISKILSESTGIPVFDIQYYYDQVDGSGYSRELKAWSLLEVSIKNSPFAILESSGLTGTESNIYKLFDSVLIVKLITSRTYELVQRYKEKLSRLEFPSETLQSGHMYDLIRMRAKMYIELPADLVFNVLESTSESIAKAIEQNLNLQTPSNQ
ncbi:MAG: hypothetical protein WCJ95_06130 [Mariniphaga sp.]